MRSASLFAVAVLAVILAASLFSPVAAFVLLSGIRIQKVTTNGDTTTIFVFRSSDLVDFQLIGGGSRTFLDLSSGDYTVTEDVPPGWVLRVRCVGVANVPPYNTFKYIPGQGVTITFVEGDPVICTFTNSPRAVGGVVMPTNMFALLSPWLAVIGLVGCIGTAAVVAKKREK